MAGEYEGTLLENMRKKLEEWLPRAARLVRSETEMASIKFVLHTPQWEDDDTLFLECDVTEEGSGPDLDGAVPEIK